MRSSILPVLAMALVGACTDATVATPPPSTLTPDGGVDAAVTADGGSTRQPGILRVATFNMHRYFDTVCDSGTCGGTAYEDLPTQAAFDATTDKLAKGIAAIDPDVIALEEVETTRSLDALTARLAALGLTYPIAHLGETGSPGSVDVAILARGALTAIKTHRDTTPLTRADGTMTTFSRELLEIRMTFGARAVVMFAAHLRSQVMDDPGRRLAEAKAARTIVAAVGVELPDALVLMGCDCNDTPGSDPINALEEGGSLLRVAKDRSVGDQGTYIYNGVKSALDHIFVVAGQSSRYVPMSATVYRDDPRSGFAGSDHAALAADFTTE